MQQITGIVGSLIYKNPNIARVIIVAFSLLGLGVAFFLIFGDLGEKEKLPEIYFRVFGGFMLIFYISIMFMCIIKSIKNTWVAHCLWAYSLFENMKNT